MGFFQNIKLDNFRNFNSFETDLASRCNVLVGKNGSGKTNILESISLFEKGRGLRKDNLKNLINYQNKDNKFIISSIFSNDNKLINLNLFNQKNNNLYSKKILINDDSSSESLKHFQSLFSLIYFLPEMERIFLSSPSLRRNFFDRLIYNVDKNYITIINNYKKNIFERHNALKNHNYDIDWIKIIEKQIADLAIKIYKKRIESILIINSNLEKVKIIQNNSYNISFKLIDDLIENNLDFKNDFLDKYIQKLANSRQYDVLVGGCKFGPHKSDINGFNIENNFNINQYSTGQQKTILLLVILAHCYYLINEIKISPIILFDEVCSHLDDENRKLLLCMIEALNIQILMTGTDKKLFSFLSTNVTYYNIV